MARKAKKIKVDISKLSVDEKKALLWKMGDLSYLVKDFQLPLYEAHWEWYRGKRDRELRKSWKDLGAKYLDLEVWLISRRYGKTFLMLLILHEFCIQRFNKTGKPSHGIICCAFQNSIASILRSIVESNFVGEGPPGYAFEYRSKMKGITDVFYQPATGSTIKLVGLDLHPDKTRGNGLDFCCMTETGFMGVDFKDTFQAVIQRQFAYRPHAFTLMETSYSKIPDHPVHTVFAQDASLRGALHERVITDTDLTEEEIQEAEIEQGGPESANCQRELYNKHVTDKDRAVLPSFKNSIVVKDYPMPRYYRGYVGVDPGFTDMLGLCWLAVDHNKKIVVVQESFTERGVLTDDMATRMRETERRLWGTHSSRPAPPPPPRSLLEALQRQPEVVLPAVSPLEKLSIDETPPESWTQVHEAPPGAATWWDSQGWTLRPNPVARFSDTDPSKLADIRARHGLLIQSPSKGQNNMHLMMDEVDSLIHHGRLVVLDNESNQSLIRQMRSGRWKDEKRSDLERTKRDGHLDALVSLALAVRAIDWKASNPEKPYYTDPKTAGTGVILHPDLRKQMRPMSRKKSFR